MHPGRPAVRHALPPWADREALRAVYDESARPTRETGEEHHVDRIISLVHPDVCGLHVPWNLRGLPAEVNWRKHNSFDGTMETRADAPSQISAACLGSSGSNLAIRSRVISAYPGSMSSSTARRPCLRHTWPPVPEPHIGPNKRSPSFVACG